MTDTETLKKQLLAFVAIPSLWGLSATAHEFVDVVLGAKWHEAVLPLMLVALTAPCPVTVHYAA